MKQQTVFKNYQLRHLDEVNELNKELVEERKKMLEEIEKIRNEEQKGGEDKISQRV